MRQENLPQRWFQKALKWKVKQKGYGTKAKLAKLLNMDPTYLGRVVEGKQPCPEEKRLKISEFFGYDYVDFIALGRHLLEGGNGDEWERERKSRLGLGNVEPGPDIVGRVPVISWVQAGGWTGIDEVKTTPDEINEWVYTFRNLSENAFALRVQGDSMEPEFTEGDIVVVEPNAYVDNGKYVIAVFDDSAESAEAVFKQIRFEGDRTYLVPKNPRYPVMDVTGKDFRIVGVVVEKTKKYA